MDGIHDLGGRQGFGSVPRDDAPYHADWERRVRGMVSVAMSQVANIDAFRHAIERLDPVTYLTIGYFGRWLAALERLVEEADPRIVGGRGEARREIEAEPAFAVGDRVRARDLHSDGHTRLPGYARGRPGTIALVHPAWVFPDTNAHGLGERPQYAYSVRFDAGDLWGDTAEAGTFVHVDLFEDYLEEAHP